MLAFSNDYYGFIFRATQSVELFCAYGVSEYLKKIWDKKEEYYLGEWHFHPADVKTPSSKDVLQMKKISEDKRFNCKEPLLLIFSRNNKDEYHLEVSLFIGSTIYKFYKK